MDPITAALNLATATLAFAHDVWNSTPADLKASEAANWAKFAINIGNFITSIQDKLNAAVK